jgi:DNA-binding NtrC family response regulator
MGEIPLASEKTGLLPRVVVVSRQAETREVVQQVGQKVFVADDVEEALDITDTVRPDLTVFDDSFGPNHIREFLNTTDKKSKRVPVVVLANNKADGSQSAKFREVGAYDYLHQRQAEDRLRQIASRIAARSAGNAPEETSAESFFVDDCAATLSMVGRSRALVKTLAMIRLVAASKCNPVLVVGETGTGKELAAKAIHTLRHPNEPFVAVNCAVLTANLLESELFGHTKGSFTGADREKTGLLELAGSGTIFLDEISEMPLDLQAKLLRVLQEKTFRKVGGVRDIDCSATIITSSNRNLYSEMKARRFRRDLYYRLNICPVLLVPLRSPDRKEDIPLLAEYFLKTSTICPDKNKKITCLTKLAVEALEGHNWPGNVRELRNVIERAMILETTDKIGLSSIILDPTEDEEAQEASPVAQIKDFSLAKAERELIARALQETGWQKTQAAALLGITRATLYAKVKQYNIKRKPAGERAAEDDTQNASLPQTVTAS